MDYKYQVGYHIPISDFGNIKEFRISKDKTKGLYFIEYTYINYNLLTTMDDSWQSLVREPDMCAGSHTNETIYFSSVKNAKKLLKNLKNQYEVAKSAPELIETIKYENI